MDQRELALVRDRRRLRARVVAAEREDAALRRGARVVRVLEYVATAVDPRALSVPHREHAVDPGAGTTTLNAAIVLDGDIPLGDRRNTAFMGTLVTYGRGKGLVTGTGMNTQIGLIAQMIQSFEDESTPLQKKLEHLGKVLGTACLAICALVFIYGLFRDTHLTEIASIGFFEYLAAEKKDIINLFMTAVSLAIAAVPEGLPAVVTITLAIGVPSSAFRCVPPFSAPLAWPNTASGHRRWLWMLPSAMGDPYMMTVFSSRFLSPSIEFLSLSRRYGSIATW